MLLMKQSEVLRVINRQDPKTLSNWYSIQDWFPPPALHGRPPVWIKESIQDWIDKWIPRLYEQGVNIPELRDFRSAHTYARECHDRLHAIVAEIEAEERRVQEVRDRINSIVRVYRRVPVTA